MKRRTTLSVISSLCLIILFGCSKEQPGEGSLTPFVLKTNEFLMETSKESPRRGEGDFIKRKDGSILFVYTRFVEGKSDHSKAVLSSRVSTDNGATWGEENDIITKGGLYNVMSVSLIRLQDGNIAMFYLEKNSDRDCYPVMRVSMDEGVTWLGLRPCQTQGKGYYVLNNSRVIQLKSGRLLVPVAQHSNDGSVFENNGSLFCFYSDDNGVTWRKSAPVPKDANIITQEPGLIELNNGQILMFIRTKSGHQYYSYSSDSGNSWSYATQSMLSSAQSPALILRNPFNDLLVAVWNNSSSNQRTPLSFAVSDDEGLTWYNEVTIENDPSLWFAYPAFMFLDENTILISYSIGVEADWGFGSLKVCRLQTNAMWRR